MWLMSVSPVGLAAAARVVAVRVWPASTYTRVTVESNHVLKYRQFALSNPERVVVDLEGVNLNGTVAKLAMRQPFVLFKGLTFQKLCLPGAFRPGDHHNKMLRPGLCVVHASPQYL